MLFENDTVNFRKILSISSFSGRHKMLVRKYYRTKANSEGTDQTACSEAVKYGSDHVCL